MRTVCDKSGSVVSAEPELKSHPNVVESSIPAAQAPIDLLKVGPTPYIHSRFLFLK